MLLEQPGRLLTRAELQSRLWSQSVVDFDHGLNKAISKIREVLGDSVESPRFVETVPRRGYRFLANVAVIDTPGGRAEPASGDLAAPDRDLVTGGESFDLPTVCGIAGSCITKRYPTAHPLLGGTTIGEHFAGYLAELFR
jgi:hypothetical protein